MTFTPDLFWTRVYTCIKRLEEGTFRLPEQNGSSVRVTAAQLAMILEGVELQDIKKRRRYKKNECTYKPFQPS